MVIVGAIRLRSVDSETSGHANAGSCCGMPPKRVPMVSTASCSSATTIDATTSTTIGPGSRVMSARPRRMVLTNARSRIGVTVAAPPARESSASSAWPSVVIAFGQARARRGRPWIPRR